jgi:hypothetical protein
MVPDLNGHGLETRVEGINPKGGSMYVINGRQKIIAKLARGFNILDEDIKLIGYTKKNDEITRAMIIYRSITDNILQRYNNAFVLVLEEAGILPRGTAFKMADAGLIDPGLIIRATLSEGTSQKATSYRFGPSHNKSGQIFEIRSIKGGGCEIAFGKNAFAEHGSTYRWTSNEEFETAQKMAALLQVKVMGESGMNPFGVSIRTQSSLEEVILDLAKMNFINAEVAEAIIGRGDGVVDLSALMPPRHLPGPQRPDAGN